MKQKTTATKISASITSQNILFTHSNLSWALNIATALAPEVVKPKSNWTIICGKRIKSVNAPNWSLPNSLIKKGAATIKTKKPDVCAIKLASHDEFSFLNFCNW